MFITRKGQIKPSVFMGDISDILRNPALSVYYAVSLAQVDILFTRGVSMPAFLVNIPKPIERGSRNLAVIIFARKRLGWQMKSSLSMFQLHLVAR